ncbi:MAG: transposase [Acidobacteriota bacterium]
MPRISRVVVPGLPHHVTQRGTGRQSTFRSDEDRLVYLDMLRENRRQYGLKVWAYCLMTNHVHLLAVPERQDSLARALARTHADYARYWNARRRSCGHVWQARFYSCPIDHEHVWNVARYIETNPVRAEIVENARDWPWSSAQAHIAGRDQSRLLDDIERWFTRYDGAAWDRVLQTSVNDEAWRQRLRDATQRGRPLGCGQFIQDLEDRLGLALRPSQPGRPRKVREQPPPGPAQMSLENCI